MPLIMHYVDLCHFDVYIKVAHTDEIMFSLMYNQSNIE